MSINNNKFPLIYPDYENSDIIYSYNNKKRVGIVGLSSKVNAGIINEINSISKALEIFGTNGLMSTLCEFALKNGASEVVTVSAGNSNDNYAAAFELLKSQDDINVVICDSESLTIQNLLKNSVLEASNNGKERVGIISFYSDEESNIEAFASNFNSERILLVAQKAIKLETELSGCILAAALSGLITSIYSELDSLDGKKIRGLRVLSNELSIDEINNYISYGIIPLKVINNNIEIVKAISSKKFENENSNEAGNEINLVLISDYIIKTVRNSLNSLQVNYENETVARLMISNNIEILCEKFLKHNFINSYSLKSINFSSENLGECTVALDFTVSNFLNKFDIISSVII